MVLFKFLIPSLVGLCLTLIGVNAECSLETSEPAPQMVTHFGSKHLLNEVPLSGIKLESYETVDIFCAKGFRYNSRGYGERDYSKHHLKLECRNEYFIGLRVDILEPILSIKCSSSQRSQMYESITSLPDCHNLMSLVVGRNFSGFGSLKTVAMCYDVANQRLKYASYTAYPSKIKMLEKTQDGQLNELGLDIEVNYSKNLFKTFEATDITEAFGKDKQLKTLFGEETFQYDNLIQDVAFTSDLFGFKDILSIIWLRALRTGNWRHLLNALQTASLKAKYDVRVGVSGTLTLPMLQQCNETRILSIDLGNDNTLSVPAHIWAHVRAVEPTENEEEFVIIGHNSPFITSSERGGLCISRCQEIPWLKDSLFNKLQHYPVYGLVQCCRLADVAHKLDNFPKTAEVPDPITDMSTTTEKMATDESTIAL